MAYKVIILYQLYMPSYFLGTFTEYPYLCNCLSGSGSTWNRTRDTRIFSPLLYRLSYATSVSLRVQR